MADSLLNHGLKNTMADAAGNLDIFLSEFERNRGQVNVRLLKMSRESLQRGMMSCHSRAIYVKLSAGVWQPDLAPVNLPAFAEALIQGRPVTCDIVNLTVRMDHTLCALVFDNAISNALRHGDPTNPDVRFTIACPTAPSNGGKLNLCFRVSNRANPRRPPKLNQIAPIRSQENECQPLSMSDGLGMEHIRLGAATQGMTYSLRPEGDLVVFSANLEVESASSEQATIAQQSHGLWSHGRTGASMDPLLTDFDSTPPSQVLSCADLQYSLRPEGDLVVFSANLEVESASSEQATIAQQSPLSPPLPRGLTYFCIDDSESQRRLVEHAIRTYTEPRDVHLFGESIAEVEEFLAVAVKQGRRAAMSPEAHGLVAILDQNIDVEGKEFKGTALVKALVGMSPCLFVPRFPACPEGWGCWAREQCWRLQEYRGAPGRTRLTRGRGPSMPEDA